MAEKEVKYDVDGFEAVTDALRTLLNSYPDLYDDEKITFADLGEETGLSMYPISGAVIVSERVDITDHVSQVCSYPITIIYRTSAMTANRRANVKEWLDKLGRWVEKQAINVDGDTYKLKEYPKLTGGRVFRSISRQTPAYMAATNDNKIEDWQINIVATYKNEFDR